MQLDFVVEAPADRDAIIEGLGIIDRGTSKTFNEAEVAGFEVMRGLKLNQGNVPNGTTLTVVIKEGE